jgi:ATP-dependent helicase/DNAse subunit B
VAGHTEVVGRRSPLVLSDYGKARLGERTHVGSTAIEKYISCRYQWFYDSVLNPEDIDSEAAEIGAGIYAHAVMQEFYTNFSALHPEGCHVTEANFEEAQQVFNDALEKQTDIFLALANHSDSFESMKYFRTQKQLQEFFNSEIGFLPFFQPTHFEYEVGSDEDKKYGRAGITLRGRADRVDMAEDGSFVIVDYKSGNVYPWSNPVGIKKTQAALYAILLKKFGEGRPVGAVYRSFKNAKASGAINTSNQNVARDDNAIEDSAKFPVSQNDKRASKLQISSFDDFLSYIEFCLARALDEMAAGNIAPSISDGDKSACRYCSAKSFCREGVGYEH